MAEKTLKKSEDYKFLGKEVAYYDGLFRLWLAIMNKIAKSEDVTNLVNHLEASFPYKDDTYINAINKARAVLDKGINKKDKFNRPDMAASRQAITEFTMVKYELLMALFQRRKVLPQVAEEEWL